MCLAAPLLNMGRNIVPIGQPLTPITGMAVEAAEDSVITPEIIAIVNFALIGLLILIISISIVLFIIRKLRRHQPNTAPPEQEEIMHGMQELASIDKKIDSIKEDIAEEKEKIHPKKEKI
jgi:uncharacterized membrane protein YqhA